MNANEILKKHEDANEMHFHEVDRKWIIEAMEEYAALRQPPVSGIAYLVAIKSGKEIEQRIIVAKDVFDVENKVLQTFKRIEWWEIRCNYGIAIF